MAGIKKDLPDLCFSVIGNQKTAFFQGENFIHYLKGQKETPYE